MAAPVAPDLLPPYLRESDKVIYSDGKLHGSIYWLMFCQFCKELRDQKGMSCEIEAKRCSSCAETFTLAETGEKETRCPQCYDCPICKQTLVAKIVPNPDGAPVAVADRKYYLTCQSCRWSTRSVGIPDASKLPSISSPWKFQAEASGDPREEIVALSNYFQGLSILEKGTTALKVKDKSRRFRVGSHTPVVDKYKLVSVAQKKLGGILQPDVVVLEAKLKPSQHFSNLTESSEEKLFSAIAPDVAEKRLSLDQKLRYPSTNCKLSTELLPRNKLLSCRRAWRCKACQHVLLKMEPAVNTIKFRMMLSAPLFVPTIKPAKLVLVVGKVSDFCVVISNPLNHHIEMTFSSLPVDEPVPKWIDGVIIQDLVIPKTPVTLLSRNCASGIDEKGKEAVTTQPNDDPATIAFRKLYVVGVRFSCIPQSSEVDNWVSFRIRYNYEDTQATIFAAEKPVDEKGDSADHETSSWIDLRIDMNLGKAS